MKLTDTWHGTSGVDYIFEYEDLDDFSALDPARCTQVYAVCFVGDRIALVHNSNNNRWGLIGGTIEPHEPPEETLRREIQEEGNLELLAYHPLGCQRSIDTRDKSSVLQLRYAALAQPYGPFTEDPAGSVDIMELVDPRVYKKYFDWGAIGERIIERGLELKPQLERMRRNT